MSTTSSLSDLSVEHGEFDIEVNRHGTDSVKWGRFEGRDILPFWIADMDFPAAQPIREAVEQCVADGIYGYAMPPKDLAPAIAAHLEREFDWLIEPEWLVFTGGVVPGLALACRAYAETGSDILINTPIYHHFFDAHDETRQQPPTEVPLVRIDDRWTFDFPALEQAMASGIKLLMLCSPHNPGGTVFTRAEIERVMALASKHDVVVVSDEVHADLVIDPSARHYPTATVNPAEASRVVTLMASSKTWNIADLKGAFAIIPDADLREKWLQTSRSLISGQSRMTYMATLAAYRDGNAWRLRLLDYLRDNYAFLQQELATLEGVRVDPMQATYLAWIDVSGLGLHEVGDTFEAFGLGLEPGEKFGKPGYVRWNFACRRALLKEGLERFHRAVDALREQC